jgi:hypothetical protein
MEVHPRTHLPGNPQSKMWLGMKWGIGRSESRYKNMSANVKPCVKRETGIWFKYRRGKVTTNILKSVIDIPFPGKIFSACFWRSCKLVAYTWKEV